MKNFFRRLATAFLLVLFWYGMYCAGIVFFAGALAASCGWIMLKEWPALERETFSLLTFFSIVSPTFLLILWACFFIKNQSSFLFFYPYLGPAMYDTSAYLVGTIFGFHKIFPSISKGKSWEGTLGGLLGLFLFHWSLDYWFSCSLSLSFLFFLSLMIAGSCFAGGACFSVLKRKAQLKDAGNLLPGHGGLLDRFDSIFATIYFLFMLMIIARFFFPIHSRVLLEKLL